MGYGDDLMVTGEVKSLQQKYPNSKFIVGDGKQSFWSEIYENNKAIIDSNQIDDYKDIIWIKNYPNHRPYRVYDKKTHTIKYTWNYAFKAKKGEIFFNLGLTFHQQGNHLEAARHFQWALRLSPDNKKISESALLKEHHCNNNPKIPCDLTKPKKHKVEGSDTISPPNYMSSSGGGGVLNLLFLGEIALDLGQ